MLTEKFHDVLNYEGVVSIVSMGADEAHVSCTWNSYLTVTDDERILIPAAGMKQTESNINHNNHVKIALGAREVMGFNNYQGTGFEVKGTAKFLTSGLEFDRMKEKYPFLNRVLEITVTSAKQLL